MKKLIAMLSTLTLTSSILPLTVGCSKEISNDLKGEPIDIIEITAEEIINVQSE